MVFNVLLLECPSCLCILLAIFSLRELTLSLGFILDFLPSDMMHGEGNLLTHLMIVGYKVTYLQVRG